MRLSHFFIDRPIFATVLSLFITIVGAVAYFALPIAQYPEIAPPTIQISASYPGASAEVISETVATPLEEQINGVENMLYLSSQSTGDGNLVITVTFKLGTNLDTAQVLTQNRVAIATPRLPPTTRRWPNSRRACRRFPASGWGERSPSARWMPALATAASWKSMRSATCSTIWRDSAFDSSLRRAMPTCCW